MAKKTWRMIHKVRDAGHISLTRLTVCAVILEAYENHFGASPEALTQSSREAVASRLWSISNEKLGKLGSASVSSPEGTKPSSVSTKGQKIPASCFKSKSRLGLTRIVRFSNGYGPRSKPDRRNNLKVCTTCFVHGVAPLRLHQDHTELQNDIISTLSTHRDLYLASTALDTQKCTREAISLHALDHVTK